MRKRSRGYFLAANASSETPTNLLFVDSESYSDNPDNPRSSMKLRFRLGVACHVRLDGYEVHSEEWLHFARPLDFWRFHERAQQFKKPLWTFAHNLPFDLTMLHFWDQLESRVFRVDNSDDEASSTTGKKRKAYRGALCLEDRPCFARVLGKRGTCWFVDSMNYFAMSLEELGKKFGRPKMKWPGFNASDAETYDYCEADVRTLRDAILHLIFHWKKNDCGNWKPTIAGLALSNYRHWHCDKRVAAADGGERFNIVIDPEHEAIPLERECYLGGRIEAFYFGERPAAGIKRQLSIEDGQEPDERPYYKLDIRACYPSIMQAGFFPRERMFYAESIGVSDLHHWAFKHGACARVLIDSPADTYPLRWDGQQIHACGRFVTALCGEELRRALSAGHVAAAYETCVYKMAPLFEGWVSHWWRERQRSEREGDTAAAEIVKQLSNSLSAKFAQRPERWEDRPAEPCLYRWGNWNRVDFHTGLTSKWRGIGGWVQERVVGDEPPHSFPAISAFITAAARERMRQLINLCPPESVFYLATDAILCNRFAYEALSRSKLIEPTQIGKLSVEGIYDKVEILGQNAYRANDKLVAGGLWGKVEELDGQRPRVQVWQRLRSIISERPDGSISIQAAELAELVPKPKGELLQSGWTRPRYFPAPPVDYMRLPPKPRKRGRDDED